ncbi:tyrosine-type recombinase/integrase [Helicobacter jaachi]|nr:site-specific integrase [Helicobacter jaachi]
MQKQQNQTSKKYEGVRSKALSNGDIAYYVRFMDKEGKRQEVKVGTKNEGCSEKKASIERARLLQEVKEAKNMQNPTIQEIMPRYLRILELHTKSETYRDYKGQCELHILPAFGAYKIQDISPKHINDFMLHLAQNKSNKTINKLIDRLNNLIEWAKNEYDLVFRNPTQAVKRLKVDNARERFMSKDEVSAVLKEAQKIDNEMYAFFALAFCTGGRLNTLRNIKLEHIDFESGTIALQDFKNNSKYSGFLDTQARKALEVYQKRAQNEIFTTPERTFRRRAQRLLNTLFNQHTAPNDRKNKVVIHSTRHTFASHLAIAGTPIHIIQKLLNHKDIKMTMRYAHLLPQSGAEYVAKLWEA